MSRQAPKPTKAQSVQTLSSELDNLVAIDEKRNAHNAALVQLQSQRDTQVGRMQVIAEQAGADLERFVTDELAKRRG